MTGRAVTGGAATLGVHHIGLTVPDLARARAFFEDVLGYKVVGEKPEYPAVFVSDGVITLTLWQVRDRETYVRFDRKKNIGLHHVALKVGGRAALDDLYERLKAVEDVTIEFAPEALGGSAVRHMMCLIPGGIRVEFISLDE